MKTSIPGFIAHKAHYFFHQGAGLGSAVADLEFEAEVGEAHYAESDWPCAFYCLFDRWIRPSACVNNIVEELDAEVYDMAQVIPVDAMSFGMMRIVEFADVDRSEIAGIIGM
mgnify:CR=1 FL=1